MNEKNMPVVMQPEDTRELSISRAPTEVLEEARRAAMALNDVISKKKNKVMFNGEQFIEAEDWQTIGKFYNVAAKIEWTKYLEIGNVRGYEAKAEVIHIPTGNVISAAEAMCMSDEKNWSNKPLNQLRSMAQTRATSKALSTVLKWVVVMAGYKATPAEEMEHEDARPARAKAAVPVEDETVTMEMFQLINSITNMLGKLSGGDEELIEENLKLLTKWTDKDKNEKWLKMADLPNIAKHKPAWIKGIHKKTLEEYQKAFNEQGNPK